MGNDDRPISDWSEIGRKHYIDKNRYMVELIISQACEDFDEVELSNYLRSQDDAIETIVQLFLSPKFNHEKLPRDIPRNITLFSQLNFWIKLKTGKSGGSIKNQSLSLSEYQEKDIAISGKPINDDIGKLVIYVEKLSKLVAPDIIKYWLMANKKLLDELAPEKLNGTEVIASNSQITRYKADAAFRYLCLFCGIENKVDRFAEYQRKYLVKGKNIPQYVSEGSETHQCKHQVRLTIKEILQKFYEIYSRDDGYLIRSLFKGVAKKAILDVYEINKSDSNRIHLEEILKSFKHNNQ